MIKPKPENLIDASQLVFLTGNETEKLTHYLTLYYKDYSIKSTQLKQAIQQKDLILAQQVAHNITGTALTIGAKPLLNASKAFELTLKKNTFDVLLGTQFNLLLDQTLIAIANTIKTL